MIVGDVTYRRGKIVDLKSIVDDAVARLLELASARRGLSPLQVAAA